MSSCDVQFSSNSGPLFQTVHYPSPVSHHNETHPSFPVVETSVEEDCAPWPPPKPSFGTLLIPDFPLDAPQITPFEVQEETQRGVVWLCRKPCLPSSTGKKPSWLLSIICESTLIPDIRSQSHTLPGLQTRVLSPLVLSSSRHPHLLRCHLAEAQALLLRCMAASVLFWLLPPLAPRSPFLGVKPEKSHHRHEA